MCLDHILAKPEEFFRVTSGPGKPDQKLPFGTEEKKCRCGAHAIMQKRELGLGNFSAIPNGIGGVEHRMELLYQGVVNGEITLERWVETCSTTPARMFGLDRKGAIAPGMDADILVWDPTKRTKIGINDKHHMNMDHSAYEGFEIDGKVDTVLSRGTVVVENDTFTGSVGHGRYVKRGLSTYLH